MKRIIVVLLIVLMDQITKYLIVANMNIGERIEIIKGYLWISSHRNSGAAWGILSGQQWLFYIITIIVVVLIIRFLRINKNISKFLEWGLLLYLGGAIGNFIDRVRFGEVVDFVDTVIPVVDYSFPIFNVADMSLVIGVGLIIISIIKGDVKDV